MQKTETILDELEKELVRILQYWANNAVDINCGGFYGEIDAANRPVAKASKGLVLNARILWTFSAAYNYLKNPEYLKLAGRAYQYLTRHFLDNRDGGLYWSVNYKGEALDCRKQIYGQGFGVYAFSEYFKASGDDDSLSLAVNLYEAIEAHSHDRKRGGYMEAFSRDWSSLKDVRLSGKDANYPKSMNTHLHILEAYANLFAVWPDPILKDNLKALIRIFWDKILNKKQNHFDLFFDVDWSVKSNTASYGHDIEGSWLINEAAQRVGDTALMEESRSRGLEVVKGVLRNGTASDHSIWYERDLTTNTLDTDRHWWAQAEALVGFMDAWEKTGETSYFRAFFQLWEYVKIHFKDYQHGEWLAIVQDNGNPLPGQPKVDFWKCPYHNSRALMEAIARVKHTNLSHKAVDQ